MVWWLDLYLDNLSHKHTSYAFSFCIDLCFCVCLFFLTLKTTCCLTTHPLYCQEKCVAIRNYNLDNFSIYTYAQTNNFPKVKGKFWEDVVHGQGFVHDCRLYVNSICLYTDDIQLMKIFIPHHRWDLEVCRSMLCSPSDILMSPWNFFKMPAPHFTLIVLLLVWDPQDFDKLKWLKNVP